MHNLVLLRRHHHLVHEAGYGVRMTTNDSAFMDRTGRTLEPAAEMRFRGKVLTLLATPCKVPFSPI